MKLIKASDYDELSKIAALLIKEELDNKPALNLGLATGGTPIGTYEELIRLNGEGQIDFSLVKTFNLDEYAGLDAKHPSSYSYYMDNLLFKHINIKKENTHIPSGDAADLQEECRAYDELIESMGGIDLQILGIGTNGHIAFNEPADRLSIGTSVVDLTPSTIMDNSRYFDSIDLVPTTAISMGIGSILKAKKIILLISGQSKRNVLKKLMEIDYLSSQLPASFLLLHDNVILVADMEALGEAI